MLSVNFDLPESIRPEIEWAWDLFCSHFRIPYQADRSNIGDLRISTEYDDQADLRIAGSFIERYRKGELHHRKVLKQEPVIRCENGEKDRLSTAFYMVNSLQEWERSSEEVDKFGRFLFTASFQYKFEATEKDLVSELFDELLEQIRPFLSEEPDPEPETTVFLTHDIDRIRQGNLREAYQKLKKGRITSAIASLGRRAVGEHEWMNMEEIMKLHESKGMKSGFFWITEQGRDDEGILNADYNVRTHRFKKLLKTIKSRGFSNGLHKSTYSKGFNEEFDKLEQAEPMNRNHYLRFELPKHYMELEEAGFLLDTSLGFREAIGFRNSYGRPFHPFDPYHRKAMQLLEVPLQIMDVTLIQNHSDPLDKIRTFLDQIPKGTTLSVLWHNNYLTDGRFADLKKTYEDILDLFKERGIDEITPQELIPRS